MPQLFGLMVIGAGLYAGYKAVVRISGRMGEELRRADDEMRRRAAGQTAEKDLGALVLDPESGVYRPAGH
jgi:hypothetical protein